MCCHAIPLSRFWRSNHIPVRTGERGTRSLPQSERSSYMHLERPSHPTRRYSPELSREMMVCLKGPVGGSSNEQGTKKCVLKLPGAGAAPLPSSASGLHDDRAPCCLRTEGAGTEASFAPRLAVGTPPCTSSTFSSRPRWRRCTWDTATVRTGTKKKKKRFVPFPQSLMILPTAAGKELHV